MDATALEEEARTAISAAADGDELEQLRVRYLGRKSELKLALREVRDRETGRRVVGIDKSPAMLAQARERVAQAGVDVALREADMREFERDEPAGLV
ncbi:MAG: methyltransferase domain-containing protein, partial [Gaiellaceae bacterium]